MAATLVRFTPDADPDTVCAAIERDGGVIVEGMFPPDVMQRVNDEVDAAVDAADPHQEFFNPVLSAFHGPNTKQGAIKAFEAMAKAGIALKFDKLHRVVGKGNFVLSVSEGSFAGKPSCYYDLFRVESGKIVEHWDTIETIPAKAEWKNQNGKF